MTTKLPDGRTCEHCAHIKHCKTVLFFIPSETECIFTPSKFYDDVMTIYNRDGTKTEVVHPFRALQMLQNQEVEG